MKPDLTSRLLAGKPGLSRPEKEAILARVLDRTAPPRRRLRWPALFVSTAAVAVAGLLFILAPRPPEFQARGGTKAAFRLACQAEPCRPGDKLVFAVSARPGAYFAAFARRADGTIIWYFPEHEGGESVAVGTDGVIDRAVRLGPEHAPGAYQVFGLVSPQPLDRPAVRKAVESAGAPVLSQPLVVAP